MTALLLDTCALIWLGNGDVALSLDARQAIEETETVYVSPISLWEISNKCRKGKLLLKHPVRDWFDRVLKNIGLRCCRSLMKPCSGQENLKSTTKTRRIA